jgi:EAL domain-containing protein (putative c-di-GMP-specific phosphodiesterase class I)
VLVGVVNRVVRNAQPLPGLMAAMVSWARVTAPARFISILEDNGMIVPVGEWVLEQACNQLAVWHRPGAAPITVVLNWQEGLRK